MKIKKLFVWSLLLIMTIGLFSAKVCAATAINSVNVSVTHPAHSAKPEAFTQVYGNCRLDVTYNSNGYKNGIRWKDVSSGNYMDKDDTFVGGKQYELSVYLLSDTGYYFSDTKTSVTVNTDSASLSVKDSGHAQATVLLTADKLYVNSVSITDLDSPKIGSKADFSVSVQGNGYELYAVGNKGMSWLDECHGSYLSNTEKFKEGHKYTVAIYLQAKSGYEFPKNVQATVNGKACAIGQNDGRILQVKFQYPTLAQQHTHTPSGWRITGAYHYKVCTVCGDFLEQDDHTGGVATCYEKGKCTVCGYAYIEENEIHRPDRSKWVACGNLYHAHLCKDCGAHAEIQDHVEGPAGTPGAAVVCRDCGYVMVAEKNHVHDLSKIPSVSPTCTEQGNIEYYVCTGCMDCFTDAKGKNKLPETETVMLGALGHSTSDWWKYDTDNHWRFCSVCKEVLAETQMAHEMQNGKCTTCGFDGTVPEHFPFETTDTTADGMQQDDDAEGMHWWVYAVIALMGIVVMGGILFVVIKSKKKVE